MNSEQIINKYHFQAEKYSFKKSARIIKTPEGIYVLKNKKNKSKKDLYNYLYNRNFDYYLPLEKEDNDYEIYKYIDNTNVNDEDKAIDLMYILSMLHTKTTTYREVLLDDVKKIYEEVTDKINYLKEYYYHQQDYIETKIYLSPAEYLLIRHASDIYASLNHSFETIEKWYKLKSKEQKERVVQLHNNLELDHILESSNKYLISWDYSEKDLAVYDFLKFYQNEYLNLEMNSLFDIYQSKYKYTETEKLLLFSLLTIPSKVELIHDNFLDTQIVSKLVKYIIKTRNFILKENEKYQEINKDEFEE